MEYPKGVFILDKEGNVINEKAAECKPWEWVFIYITNASDVDKLKRWFENIGYVNDFEYDYSTIDSEGLWCYEEVYGSYIKIDDHISYYNNLKAIANKTIAALETHSCNTDILYLHRRFNDKKQEVFSVVTQKDKIVPTYIDFIYVVTDKGYAELKRLGWVKKEELNALGVYVKCTNKTYNPSLPDGVIEYVHISILLAYCMSKMKPEVCKRVSESLIKTKSNLDFYLNAYVKCEEEKKQGQNMHIGGNGDFVSIVTEMINAKYKLTEIHERLKNTKYNSVTYDELTAFVRLLKKGVL